MWMTPSSSTTKTKSTSSTPATSTSTSAVLPPGSSSPPAPPKPDLYAQKFIPQWLQQVNSLPAFHTFFAPSPAYIDFEEYAQTFLAKPLFAASPSSVFLATIQSARYALDVSPLGPQIPVQKLDMRNYAQHFRNALIEERRALAEEFKQYNLFETELETTPYGGMVMYKLNVPGLREYVPAIFVGDTLIIRAIRVPTSPLFGPFDGYEYVGYIWAIDRFGEFLILHLPDLQRINSSLYNIPLSYNVQFYPRNTVETYQMMVSDVFAQRLAVDDWTRRMLFPDKSHAKWFPERELGRAKFDIEWVDKELNYEQQKSVDAIVTGSHGDLPFLIYGPPGTGKTKTVIEAILQLVKQEDVHILAVAPSPSAADTIALRLVPHLRPGQMYRINDIARTFPEVPDKLMLYCHTAESYFSFPAWEKLMAAKVVVTDCMSSFELIKARCTNRDVAAVKEVYGKAFGVEQGGWHWTHLFVDEAAQAREPETLIPLMVVAPGISGEVSGPKLVLAGDSNQLGPGIVAPVAREMGVDVSLFDRLLRRPIYAQHPLSRQNVYKRNTEKGWYRPAFVNLIRNYRSHAGILMMPSAMFYNSTLLPEAKQTSSLTKWKGLPNKRIPVVFHPSTGDEIWIQDTAGWYNPSEIGITTNLITNLLTKSNTPGTQVFPHQVAVIAPFREHVVRMRVALRALNLAAVSVGTVENYQGGEMRVTILNCVRSKERFLDWDKKKGRGVVGEKRRFNVAITRAKELLIIIGNPAILQTDIYWRGYLSFIQRNNLSKESFVFEDDQADRWMSSLERGMRISDEVLKSTRGLGDGAGGDGDVYGDEAMWNVGAALEQLVLEEDWDGGWEEEGDNGVEE